jgi:hypothetical protein
MGLMAATGLFAVGNPLVLVAIPFGLLVLFMPSRRLLAVAVAAVGLTLSTVGDASSGFWYFERGWAFLLGGCFLAVSLRWPKGRFLARGLGAVFAAFAGMGLVFGARPGDWAVVDWAVRSRMELAMSSFLQAVRVVRGPQAIPAEFEARALETMAVQSFIFPALLGLASLSALGLAWWLHKRLSRSPGEGLGPLREFRFSDQMIWVLVLGILAFLFSSGTVERIGVNTVVFMGALYVLRGAAVVLFLTGGLTLLGSILLLVGLLIVAPFVVVGALIIGLGDTWFDLRARRVSHEPEA